MRLDERDTTIERTDATWNPVTGCTEVTDGCDHRYADTFPERRRGTFGSRSERNPGSIPEAGCVLVDPQLKVREGDSTPTGDQDESHGLDHLIRFQRSLCGIPFPCGTRRLEQWTKFGPCGFGLKPAFRPEHVLFLEEQCPDNTGSLSELPTLLGHSVPPLR
ncbi:DUF5131 family protein [Amycolatopsis sp. NPDC004368]